MNDKCRARGSERVLEALQDGLSPDEATILTTDQCFGYCEEGPNIALNDNLVKGVKPFLAVETVRQELADPSCKADGIGSRGIEELDDMLESIDRL
jgi:NADH:ubiquinone oxidoreductase subunit E